MNSKQMLVDFVTESNKIEGILREPTAEEIQAHYDFVSAEKLSVEDVVRLVSVLQPDAELRDRFNVPGVRVGNHVAPPSGPDIRGNLESLLYRAHLNWAMRMRFGKDADDNPWKIHCDYEVLHPFTDGNGRSGRGLWLWMYAGHAPLGFLHQFYYETLSNYRA